MNLVIFGPPGSGKGTQAERMRDAHALRHISTGDLLREAVAAESELGKKVKGILAAGELVSDDIVLALIEDAVAGVKDDASFKGWLLDGFPRTVGQAEGLDGLLNDAGERIDALVVLDVPRETIIERLTSRGRADDTPETVSNRLDVYEAQTRPILDHYDGKVTIHRINGDQTIDEVATDIASALR